MIGAPPFCILADRVTRVNQTQHLRCCEHWPLKSKEWPQKSKERRHNVTFITSILRVFRQYIVAADNHTAWLNQSLSKLKTAAKAGGKQNSCHTSTTKKEERRWLQK
jgi:hypothetical protein